MQQWQNITCTHVPHIPITRLNPSAVTEDITETPLEIAATNVNTKAFDLLAPHYEENTRKKISQLMIWALTEAAPSAAFMSLFESVPVAEVRRLSFQDNVLFDEKHSSNCSGRWTTTPSWVSTCCRHLPSKGNRSILRFCSSKGNILWTLINIWLKNVYPR